MAIYSVYEPLEKPVEPEAQAEQIVFAKEGFSILAYLVPPLYFLFRRMWVVLAVYLAVVALITFVVGAFGWPASVAALINGGLNVLVGLESRNLYQMSLERSGYKLKDVVVGSSLAECEQTFFSKWEPTPMPGLGASVARHPADLRLGFVGQSKQFGRRDRNVIGSLGGS